MNRKKILILGGTGFIGKNLVNFFISKDYFVTATRYKSAAFIKHKNLTWIKTNLTQENKVKDLFNIKYDLVLQAAATTSGSKDIINNPSLHVTDNAIMNSLILRSFNESNSYHIIFFSCTVMLNSSHKPIKEKDYKIEVDPIEKYFGVAWTKIYVEKIMKFYSNINTSQKYTAIRHSNIYGPYDKFDLEKGHVMASAMVKINNANNEVIMWGSGSEKRDLLYIDDLCELIIKIFNKQSENYLLINCGLGKSISVKNLYSKIIEKSNKKIKIIRDLSKPSIKFNVTLDCSVALKKFGWKPKISINKGIEKTLKWYKKQNNEC